MEGNYQINDIVYKCHVTRPLPKKVYVGLAEGEWKVASITINYHLKLRDIPVRQHFQVTCCTWKDFK